MYIVAKFQPCMPVTLELQPYEMATTERSICTTSILLENKLQALTKTAVTYEHNEVQSYN